MAPHPDPMARGFTTKFHNDTYPAIAKSNQTNRTVFVSGASRGIGEAIAISFAKAGAAAIAIAARSNLDNVEKKVITAAKSAGHPVPNVLQIQVDVTSQDSLTNAASTVEKTFGRLDILVNNAGYNETWVPVMETDPKDWWMAYEVNVKGVYLACRAFLPLLLKGGEKTILNISSVGALMTYPGASGYQTSKLAVLRLTEFLQAEYATQGLIAYAIHPGGVATELASNMPKAMHAFLTDTPALAADTISWLTEERREWLSGRYISVTWDMTELMAKKDEIEADDKLKSSGKTKTI